MARKLRVNAVEQLALITVSPFDQTTTEASFNTSTRAGLEAWIYWHYRQKAFSPDGEFKGLNWFKKHLCSLDTGLSKAKIWQAIQPLLNTSHKYSLAHTERITVQAMPSQSRLGGIDIDDTMPGSIYSNSSHRTSPRANVHSLDPAGDLNHLLTGQMDRVCLTKRPTGDIPSGSSEDFDDMDFLLSNASGGNDDGNMHVNDKVASIQHAPLVDVSIISRVTGRLLPQYALLGSHDGAMNTKSKLLLNTNVPFSTFLCGVQGSGKSHTTSCILENSLVPSKHLGKLQSPLSALVFSYAQFSGDGVGFTVSEAAFLASSSPELPDGAHVKRVHVLVSPSNFVRISKLYLQLPNVLVTPFKLNPMDLDINTMLTLMNVSESDETPLYMAQVTQILREMSTAGGPFNYKAFKLHLEKKKFNPTQVSMLQMRLDLLESFLDMNANCPEPRFHPGEITIMDMSCPFVDANMACILFEIGLKQYLQSKGNGKIIVLDEAHKYMLNVPGAKSLNETLRQTIRLQRHYGARVVISTQEPTLLTDLIALCSVTIIHRFSSPQWLSAIRRHIPTTAEDLESLMRRIESLTTGRAMVYSPSAVFGCDESGNLITGTSRFVSVNVRKRITSDGGQSVLAV
ncbi:hypothetical protein N0V83_000094 [Neocucurbitaria cava]|uniref:AAA+ ATPase domain-containing protein n=1 Tax=Neocucurbitaria cava TaxID=798079 RepID=A0A9W9CQT4_9PLEO|nr:hypothetical protein N0V83_000094 [Neocucurbitaria cava]